MCKLEDIKVLVYCSNKLDFNNYKKLEEIVGRVEYLQDRKDLEYFLTYFNFKLIIIDDKFDSTEDLSIISFIKKLNPEIYIILVTNNNTNISFFDKTLEFLVNKVFIKPLNLDQFYKYINDLIIQILYNVRIKNINILENLILGVSNVPISVLIVNKLGTIEYVNSYFLELTGYNLNEVIGKNPNILKSGQHPQKFYADMWNTILSGKIWYNLVCNKRKNGDLYWHKLIISPVIENNDISKFIGISVDATDQKEKDLELNAILDSLDDIFFIFDKNYNCKKSFPEFNIINDFHSIKKLYDFVDYDIISNLETGFKLIDSGTKSTYSFYFSKHDLIFEVDVKRYNSSRYIVWFRDVTDKLKLRVLYSMNSDIQKIIESNEKIIKSLL